MSSAGYLPDELLLEVVAYINTSEAHTRQSSLARFCRVNRQWYDLGVGKLYEAPILYGRGYELFVSTICPSVIPRIRPSSLSGLVKELDLSHIVHNGNKATTARLLGRTKHSLEVFTAPQASFAVNCWAALSKCLHLRVLDLSLVSQAISFQSLNKTMRQLPHLTELYLPRCTSSSGDQKSEMNVRLPPRLQHISLSGKIMGPFLWDMLRSPDNFPPTLTSLSIVHCPSLTCNDIQTLLEKLSHQLTTVELRDLPAVNYASFNPILDWLPNLTNLTIALEYLNLRFSSLPTNWSSADWSRSKPLQSLTLVTSGETTPNPRLTFFVAGLCTLIFDRYLGRLRFLNIAESTEWILEGDGTRLALLARLMEQMDEESWMKGRWHYADVERGDMTYEKWTQTTMGKKMKPRARVLQGL